MSEVKIKILPSGNKLYPCGCVENEYWCIKHDIYVRQDRKNDPRWNGKWSSEKIYRDEPLKPDGCSCHISAPCSFCTWEADHSE